MLNARLRERVCVRKCIGVVAAVVAVAPCIRARALAPPQPCAAVVNESCQREREKEREGGEGERKREKWRRNGEGERVGESAEAASVSEKAA